MVSKVYRVSTMECDRCGERMSWEMEPVEGRWMAMRAFCWACDDPTPPEMDEVPPPVEVAQWR